MQKNIFDYFIDFENKDLKQHDNAFLFADHQIKPDYPEHLEEYFDIRKFLINNTPILVKEWQNKSSVFSIASSKMYGDIGILTPPEYIIKHAKKSIRPREYNKQLSTFTQNVHSIKNIVPVLAIEIVDYQKIIHRCGDKNYKWSLLTEPALRSKFLEFMTEQCLDELIILNLADELRTEVDRHLSNFFLYKTKLSDKFEGIIAIDNGFGQIAQSDCNFNDIQYFTYGSTSPQGGTYTANYPRRIEEIENLLQAGYLTQKQINFLKNLISYDFPETIKHVCKKYKIKGKTYNRELYDNTAKLWEYNRNTLGKDLEL